MPNTTKHYDRKKKMPPVRVAYSFVGLNEKTYISFVSLKNTMQGKMLQSKKGVAAYTTNLLKTQPLQARPYFSFLIKSLIALLSKM